MAGKPIGEFSMKMITITNTPGPAGSLLIQVNFEGTATGFGSIFETATFIGGGKDGTFSIVGSAYMDNGEIVNGIVKGATRARASTSGRPRTLWNSQTADASAAPVRSTWPRGHGRGKSPNSAQL